MRCVRGDAWQLGVLLPSSNHPIGRRAAVRSAASRLVVTDNKRQVGWPNGDNTPSSNGFSRPASGSGQQTAAMHSLVAVAVNKRQILAGPPSGNGTSAPAASR